MGFKRSRVQIPSARLFLLVGGEGFAKSLRNRKISLVECRSRV
jgi:hypothetical protein